LTKIDNNYFDKYASQVITISNGILWYLWNYLWFVCKRKEFVHSIMILAFDKKKKNFLHETFQEVSPLFP